MAEQLIKELEEAAQIILAPPNLVTPQERQTAETVFLNFQKTKSPYQLCRQILESRTTDYVLFEAAGLIKTAIIQEWSTLPQSDITSLRQYLLHYILNRPNLAPYVKGCILTLIVIIIKRGSITDMGEERKRILGEVEGLIMNGDQHRQVLGYSIISTLIQEYTTNVKSSDMGLTWEVHLKEKKAFEATDLKRIFKFCIGILGELVKKDLQEENTLTLLKHLLPIVESVLAWDFSDNPGKKSSVKVAKMSGKCLNNGPLILNTDWQDIILDPTVLDLVFTLYWKVRRNPQLAYHARTCVVQLSSIEGPVMSNDAVELQYVSEYMERFLNLISNIQIIDEEAYSIVNIIQRIIVIFETTLTALPKHLLKSFMEQTLQLTCSFIENAAQEEYMDPHDCLYTEALEPMFDMWIIILSEETIFSVEFCKQSSIQIFDVYLRCHLSPPEGVRSREKYLNQEEIDIEEDDKVRFKAQLQTVGNFAREVPSHSIPLLAQLIENRTSQLRENLNKLVSQTDSMSKLQNESMARLYEDIHWLLLIAGHVLCKDPFVGDPMIPSEIICYSMEQIQQGHIDINLTLQHLISSQDVLSKTNAAPESIDHVIRLVADIFLLCAIEKTAISIHLENVLSPELSCTIMWFLHRLSLSYLLPVEDCYYEISPTLEKAFGENSSVSVWVVKFLLEKIECNINVFNSEPAVINETIKLLISLVASQEKADCVFETERFEAIVKLAIKYQYNFSQTIKRGLMRAVVQAGTFVRETSKEEYYWTVSLQPLQDRCRQITSNENFRNICHQEEIKVQIVDILESLIGVAQGADNTTVDPVFEYSYPVLQELPKLLSLYHNYQQIIQLILELLCEYTKGILGYLTENDTARFYEICLSTIQTYARCKTNRVTVDSTAEEDSYHDILLLMQLLTCLLSTEILNTHEEHPLMRKQFEPSDFSFNAFRYGLNIIMPLITADLLKFPSLCLQYFKMITLVCEIHCDKVCSLSAELLQQLLASIELGLYSFGYKIAVLCYDIIQALAFHIYSKSANGTPRSQVMAPFLNLLMSLILSHQIESDLISTVAPCLYCLIGCYEEQYRQLVQNILSGQTDQQVAQRLAGAFTKLTENIELNQGSSHSKKFESNLNNFIIDIQGFLMVK